MRVCVRTWSFYCCLLILSAGACFDDATHHWPMDKLDGGGIGDIAGGQHGRVLTGVGQIVNTGPAVHSGFRTAGVSLRESDRGTIDLGDFSALQMMNFRWVLGKCSLSLAPSIILHSIAFYFI